MAYDRDTEYTATMHPDGIRLSWEDGDIDMPGRTDEGVWDIIARYCEQDPELWDALSEDNLVLRERTRDDLLFDEAREWSGEGWDATYDWSLDTDGGELTIVMHGDAGDRATIIPAGYREVAALDEGGDPVRDRWEDGNGNGITYDGALPWDGEQVLPWIVEVIDEDDDAVRRTYHEDEMDAEIAAETAWEDMDTSERLHSEIRYGRVDACSDDLDDYERIGYDWRMPSDIPWSEVREYLDPYFANDVPAELIAEAGGVDEAVDEWTQWWFGEGDGSCGCGVDNQADLAEHLGITPRDLKPLVARYMVEDSRASEVTAVKTIAANGNGLMVSITREARMLGLDRGDDVQITIRRM